MPRIIAAAHNLPSNKVAQSQVRKLIEPIFRKGVNNLPEQLQVFDNARIETRWFVKPAEWYQSPHSARECNGIYLDEGILLLQQAAQSCLDKAGMSAADVDHLICVSTTGHATPSLEARLFDRVNFPPTTVRTPIWGLGCAAGAAGLARANDYCRAYPRSRVLLLALEICSLTFQQKDTTLKNLVGTALFSDGAAAVLVAGDEISVSGPRILGSQSHLFADTGRIMGWDFNDSGMQLVLSPKLPSLVLNELPQLVENFMADFDIKPADINHYLMHPGGARIIDAYKKALGLRNKELYLSEESLRQHGNISSVSVLMVLEEWLATKPENNPGYGLMSAFGPGFSAELLLLES